MSVMPELAAPTLVGPYKQIPGGMMPMPGQPAPPSPADLARQRKNQGIDAKRRAGTQARQVMQQMPAQAAPALAVAPKPPVVAQPQAATPDAYLQSQQNLIGSENNLLGLMGKPAPQYKPPNKGLEYLAAGIALLFPGAPIANAASGLLQGMQGGAEQRYQRETQAQQQEIGNAERQTQVFGTIADAQARIAAQLEATRERAAEYAQRHADTLSALQEKRSEFQQLLPIRSAASQSLINYRIGELSNAAARNTITQQDAELRAQTVVQIAAFREASMNGRHASDLGMRSAAQQLGLLEKQTDSQIKALDASVAADPTQAATAQAAAAQLIANEQNQAQKIIGNVASGKPDILKISDFAVPLPLPSSIPQGGYDPNAGYQGGYQPPAPGQIPSAPINWGVPSQQQPVIPNQQQVQSDEHATADPFPGHPGVGKGSGVDPKTVAGYEHLLSQHGGKFQSQDQVLHEIAQTESLKNASEAQIHALVNAWAAAHKPAAHTAALSPGDQQVLDLRTKAWEAQGFKPDVAHAKALAELKASNMPQVAQHTQTQQERINFTLRVLRGQPVQRIMSALQQLGVDQATAQRLAQSAAGSSQPSVAQRPFVPPGGSNAKNPFELVQFTDPAARQDMPNTDQRLQYGLGYVLGPFAPDVTSVRHGIHHPGSAHYEGKAVDVGAFGGTQVGANDVTWRAVMTGIASHYFRLIGTIPEIALNPEALAFAHDNGVKLVVDVGMDPAHPNRHVHFEVE